MTTATAPLYCIDQLGPQATRVIDAHTTLAQLGRMTVLAVSGGRVSRTTVSGKVLDTVVLPESCSREVWITLEAHDLYTVRLVRRITRGANRGRVAIERTFEDIDCEALSQVAYDASCWK